MRAEAKTLSLPPSTRLQAGLDHTPPPGGNLSYRLSRTTPDWSIATNPQAFRQPVDRPFLNITRWQAKTNRAKVPQKINI
jgi:hypothetical protein